MIKVIGAGFGRTGTLSLKYALEQLGFDKCYHMMEVLQHPHHREVWTQAHRGQPVDWHALFEGYQASVDWPSCNLWREQMLAFPDAKVLLSLRDPERWYDSVMATIYKVSEDNLASDDPRRQAGGRWAHEIIWDRIFDGCMHDRAHVIDVYNRHNETVMNSVPSDRVLAFQPGDGWEPLCGFLGVPVPQDDYPRVNTREEFGKIFAEPLARRDS